LIDIGLNGPYICCRCFPYGIVVVVAAIAVVVMSRLLLFT